MGVDVYIYIYICSSPNLIFIVYISIITIVFMLSFLMSIPITFWSTPESTHLLSIGTTITGLSRSKLIQLLIDTHLDSLIASFSITGLESEANTIKSSSNLPISKRNTPTNKRFGISLKNNKLKQ